MKLMIATMIRGSRSWRSASTRSWNGVVNASSSAAWTLIQLLSAIVANWREALAADRQRERPEIERRRADRSGRVNTSGSAASRNGSGDERPADGRNGPSRAARGAGRRSTQPGHAEGRRTSRPAAG